MATIEERATRYAEEHCYIEPKLAFTAGYVQGAIEQRKIDIEKACDFIIRKTTLDRWVNVDVMAEELRKAMEE